MNIEPEIRRLLDLMPASGRMYTKIVSKSQQNQVINAPFPMPWKMSDRYIYINFNLWRRLSKPQRDLLLLRAVSNVLGIKWFKPSWDRGIVLAGLLGVALEGIQGDSVGIVVAGGLSAIAASQIWRNNRSIQKELEADETAIKVAQRRGYIETEAAAHLLSAIEAVAEIEGRLSLNFSELIRTQNLKTIANISPIGVPQGVRQE